MPLAILTVVAQSVSAIYLPCKDLYLCLTGEKQYIEELEDNLRNLITEVMSIKSKMKDIDRILVMHVSKEKNEEYQIVENQIEIIMNKYTKFITKYQKVTRDLKSYEHDHLDVSTGNGIVNELQHRKPKILTRKFCKLAQLSKDIAKLKDEVSLVCDRVKVDNLTIEKKPKVVEAQHAGSHDIPAREDYVHKILEYLNGQSFKRIGVVGPIGVGKTFVLRKLNNQLEETNSVSNMSRMLDIVIWITFPKGLDTEEKNVEKIQEDIMERLKLNLEQSSSAGKKKSTISSFLSQKKYVVLIDHVSSYIDLNDVGLQDDHEYGKVVLASYNRKVISQMTEQLVEIGRLSKFDASDLFQKIYGEIEDDHEMNAQRIIEYCGGLPPVITFIATYLKDRRSSWYDVKRSLMSDTKCDGLLSLGGIGKAYEMVYEELEKDYMKKCLLYGALFPREHSIPKDYLIECWMAEGFIDIHDAQKLRATRDHGVTVLKELTDKYLLEWCSEEHVKMPSYCRKVALSQTYPTEHNCVVWVPWNNKVLNEEIWKKATRMSMISCDLELPEVPESRNMTTLLLQSKPHLARIGASFFLHMQSLRVLDLCETEIEFLPTSINSLVDLVILYLINCSKLGELPCEVRDLKKLEVLDIRGTSIRSLPEEIGDMVHLRCLRLSFAQIPKNIIYRLQQLEEFTIEARFLNPDSMDIAEPLVDELATLKHLNTLGFNFPNVRSLQKFVTESKSWSNRTTHWDKHTFRSFKISIGSCEPRHPYDSDISSTEKQLRFCTGEGVSSVKEVLKQANAFELAGHLGVESLSDFDLANTKSLKVCVVEGCSNLLNIVDADTTGETEGEISEVAIASVFQSLEKLHLYNLQSMKSIWKGSVVFPRSLSNLKALTLYGCPELVEILNHELANALVSLKHLKVENCAKLVVIVSHSHEHANSALHMLETIELINLPELQSIYAGTSTDWISLRKIVILNCNGLRNMSPILAGAEMLEAIKCEASWWDALELPEKECFLPLCELVVMEQPPLSIKARSEGETSSTGKSVECEASEDTINGGNISNEDLMPNNDVNEDFSHETTTTQQKLKQVSPVNKYVCAR